MPIPALLRHPHLRDLAESRAAELVRYQSRRYARRFVEVVTQVATAEERASVGSTAFTEATVHGLFKLMAYKDEYEVARLSLDPRVRRDIETQFGSGATVRWQIHPPILRAMGMSRKLSLGRWFVPVFWLLHRMRRLRGTRFDPFGHTALRRLERRLVDEYVDVVRDVSTRLHAGSLGVAAEIAALPDMVRGYESIKEHNVESYRAAVAGALRRFDELAPHQRG
jgi:indolepyruvate ferredoxin oxidoreductase